MTREKIIIDTDTGVDDTMAILLALNSSELDICAFTTVHGNAELKDCTKNVLRLLELTHRKDIPVAIGAGSPLIRKATYGKYVHGEDGTGNCNLDEPTLTATAEHGVDLIGRLVHESPGEITIVALGPLTNIALAIAKDRSLIRKIKQIVFMGGTYLSPGNATSVATANLFHDPHAARIVYDSGVHIVSVGLDACRNFFFTEDLIDSFNDGNSYGKFIYKISKSVYLDFYSNVLGYRGYQSNDTPSIGYLIAPELFDTVEHHVDIEIGGEFTTAQTVVDYKKLSGMTENVTICTDLKGLELRKIFFNRVINS